MGMEPRDFEITRWLSPEEFRMERYKVVQFPIVEITDKRYRQWVEKLIKERLDKVPF